MSIYKSEKGKQEILELYDKQLQRLNMSYSDIWINTSFGKTHLVETGNLLGIPLLVFHGGNATTAYNLLLLIVNLGVAVTLYPSSTNLLQI